MCGLKKVRELVVRLRYIVTGKYPQVGFTMPWGIVRAYSLEKKLGKLYLVEVSDEAIIFRPVKGDDKS
jgi:hypothetical protein